jgi:hypothetical protein
MRCVWPLAMMATLGMAGIANAQFTPTFAASNSAKISPVIPITGPTMNFNQMVPKVNPSSAFITHQPNPRNFNFAKLMPSFSFPSMLPRPSFSQLLPRFGR